ncbi:MULTISPECIES: hypothetical protein [Pseudomonas]|jgi:hypothetical protein|uniref:hypothetical protein n=1 Tax=Pseudomonas TaxID=286 RepID=UPI0012D2C404|nr:MULTISPECIES: hypothetical protein [Pseudomonas]
MRELKTTLIPVGAGLPAMAAADSALMLIDTPLSRAGSLPQADCIATKEFMVIEK